MEKMELNPVFKDFREKKKDWLGALQYVTILKGLYHVDVLRTIKSIRPWKKQNGLLHVDLLAGLNYFSVLVI